MPAEGPPNTVATTGSTTIEAISPIASKMPINRLYEFALRFDAQAFAG
jgi:hypothetical protein